MIELGLSTLLISPQALATRVHLFACDRPRGVARACHVECMLAHGQCILSCICSRAIQPACEQLACASTKSVKCTRVCCTRVSNLN